MNLSSSIIVPLVTGAETYAIFIRRAAHLRRNPSQMAFPGGLVHDDDAGDAAQTALREFEEELGVPRERVSLIARLEDVVTLSQKVTIAPFVGRLSAPVAYRPDASEIESVHEIPLAAIYEPHAVRYGVEPIMHEGVPREVPSWLFDYADVHVWGATARILHLLLNRYPTAASIPGA